MSERNRSSLKSRYDAILFGPIGYSSTQLIVDGFPMYGKPIPWNKSVLPNTLPIDETDDIRPGLGSSGVANLKRFVSEGFTVAGVGRPVAGPSDTARS